MMRVLASLGIAAVVVYAAAGAALFFFQRQLVFMNDTTQASPAEVGLADAEVHRLLTVDGVELVAWLARQPGDRLAIYFHGNGGSLAWRAPRIRELADLGFSVLAIDYRGFGGSSGQPSEAGLMHDADAAYAFARKLGYPPSRLLLYGESLGSGVAVALAARSDVGGVILDAAFSSIVDVAAARYWMFPVRALLRDPFRSDALIGLIAAPILMLHGTNDRVVPIRMGQALFAQAASRAAFVTIEGGGHMVLDDDAAQAPVKAWLAQTFAMADRD